MTQRQQPAQSHQACFTALTVGSQADADCVRAPAGQTY